MDKTEVLGRSDSDDYYVYLDNFNGLVKMRRSTSKKWTRLPPKQVQILLMSGSALRIIEEWKKILGGEIKPDKSIYVNALMKRIKKRFL